MIKKLVFSNFHSFAEETTIDFGLSKKPTSSGYDISINEERWNKAIAIVGANGSGKTQMLKPLAFLSWFVSSSFLGSDPDDTIPCSPHAYHKDQPTRFELDFTLEGIDHRYQLELTPKEVLSEVLFVKTSSQFSYLFKREKAKTGYSFKQKGFPFAKTKAEELRSNASLISAAHSYDVKEARPLVEFFDRIQTNVNRSGRRHFQFDAVMHSAEKFEKQPELKSRMSEVMSHFDLGLSGVDIRKAMGRDINGQEETLYLPFGRHIDDDGQVFELPFFEESSGTQSAFVLLEPILKTLQYGGIAVIDELDNDLHPHLVPELMDWFRFEHTNPHQAQLIFTCHSPEVLDRLQKHQVYLVEKHNQCSEAWRLDEVSGLRADDNLYAKYMAGALGAVPDL